MRVVLTPSGEAEILTWNDRQKIWVVYLTQQVNDCDQYGLCGAYGICNINKTPRCECLRGFVPKFPEKWETVDFSDGCVRKTNLVCGTDEGFVKHSDVKLPDTRRSWCNMTINLQECERQCLKNCSCTGYANADIRSEGHGCILWFIDLIDIRNQIEDGQGIYVKMPTSELGKDSFSLRLIFYNL